MTLLRLPYLRYVVVSAGALAADMAIFMATLELGAAPAAAAATGYLFGVAIHWLLSSRAVFAGQLRDKGVPRLHQQGLFLGSALVGLGLTTAIVGIGAALGLDPRIAKLAAVVVSFQVTYLLRRKIVFSC